MGYWNRYKDKLCIPNVVSVFPSYIWIVWDGWWCGMVSVPKVKGFFTLFLYTPSLGIRDSFSLDKLFVIQSFIILDYFYYTHTKRRLTGEFIWRSACGHSWILWWYARHNHPSFVSKPHTTQLVFTVFFFPEDHSFDYHVWLGKPSSYKAKWIMENGQRS